MDKKGPYLSRMQRKNMIFESILNLTKEKGLFGFTIKDVAERSECTGPTIRTHFGGLRDIREEVIVYAQHHKIVSILNTSIVDLVRV